MKNKKSIIYVIFGILLIMICILLYNLVFIDNKKLPEDKTKYALNGIIKDIINNDYIIAKLMTGDLQLTEASIKINNRTYNYINEKGIKKIQEIEKIINETYTTNWYQDNFKFLHEGNHFIESGDLLFTDLEKQCDIGDYLGDKFKIVKTDQNQIVINYYGNEFTIFNENNNWKLNYNIYRCPEVLNIEKETIK